MSKYKDKYHLIIKDYQIGLSAKEICSKYKIKSHIIDYVLETNNIHRIRIIKFKPSIEQQLKIIENYKSGISITDLAKDCKTHYKIIKNILIKNNIKLREIGDSFRRYVVDETVFDNLNSIEIYWLLGWFISDGHISKNNGLMFGISSKDKEVLYKFKDILKSTHPIKNKFINNKKTGIIKEYSLLNIINRKLGQSINKLGFDHNKTYTLKWQEYPKEMMSHLIRGIFEGDGNIYINKLTKKMEASIVSSANFCYGLQNFCKNNLNINVIVEKMKSPNINCPAMTCRFSGNYQTIKFMLYIYNNCGRYFLTRKLDYFIDAFDFYLKNIKRNNANNKHIDFDGLDKQLIKIKHDREM